MTSAPAITYSEFSQDYFKGKEIFRLSTNEVIQKWEAYHLIKNFWMDVWKNTDLNYGCREKQEYNVGKYESFYVKKVKARVRRFRGNV